MDQNGERRSRVPAGTFGSSKAPTPPTPSGDAAQQADRRRFIDTLTGEDPALTEADAQLEAAPPPSPPAEPPPASPAETEARRSGTGTLVGHPQVAPPPQASAPVLSPPKWRGAQAYLEGEEPQPRISSIPTPPLAAAAAPVKPVGVAIGVLRSRVTTKMGLPTKPVPPAGPPGESEPAIDDTIQQMLEHQASVQMQVEEPVGGDDSIPELRLDELGGVEERSVPAISTAAIAAASPPPPPPSKRPEAIASHGENSAAPPPPPEPTATAAASETASAAGREREASSLAPPEVARRLRRGDSHVGLGALFVAAMALIGGGGWLLTRGGYFSSRVQSAAPAATPKPVVEPAAVPGVPSNLAPPAVPAQAQAQAAAVPAPSTIERAPPARAEVEGERSAKREARSARTEKQDDREPASKPDEPKQTAEPAQEEPEPPAADDGDRSVLTVKPRSEPGSDLPDTPSREDVIAALDPLRPAVNECAHGQRGMAQLDITVSSSGQVSHAVVGGDFAGTPEGSCIARAARTAQFTPFKKPRFRVIYPFQL